MEGADASLLDIVDHLLTKGVVVTGDVVLGLADVDLVYLRLAALLCAADRVLPPAPAGTRRRPHAGGDARPRRTAAVPG
ncbi:MAG TPA: gas vesicle protein [Methylomirabilota bacterium]|nr:gas vesicle protein [Methylomirabilota bacterium]